MSKLSLSQYLVIGIGSVVVQSKFLLMVVEV